MLAGVAFINIFYCTNSSSLPTLNTAPLLPHAYTPEQVKLFAGLQWEEGVVRTKRIQNFEYERKRTHTRAQPSAYEKGYKKTITNQKNS